MSKYDSVDNIPEWMTVNSEVYDLLRGDGYVVAIDRDYNGRYLVKVKFESELPLGGTYDIVKSDTGIYDLKGVMHIADTRLKRTLYPHTSKESIVDFLLRAK